MKSPPDMVDDDDMFGPPRTYPIGFSSTRNRPLMISAKYRQKEERRKVLKISIGKLKKIEDPETSLCRSVLINNTMRMLQQEAKDEKIQKQQLNYPRCYDNDHLLNIKSEFMKNEVKLVSAFEENDHFNNSDITKTELSEDKDFDKKLAEELNTVRNLTDENMVLSSIENLTKSDSCSNSLVTDSSCSKNSVSPTLEKSSSKKRAIEDLDDCDVSDVLSQFYMPPTPRMLTCIDEDEDVNVVDDEPLPKRAKNDLVSNSVQVFQESNTSETLKMDLNLHNNRQDVNVDCYHLNTTLPHESRPRLQSDEANPFSCARHASTLFNEFQNTVYHNLIASLET